MQLNYAGMVDSSRFAYIELAAPNRVRTCALCSTSIAAARAAGDGVYLSVRAPSPHG